MATVSGNVSNPAGGASIDPVTAAVQAAATIANVIAGISDMNKRRLIESNLALLSEKQKIALAQQIARQQNKNDQVTIIANAVLTARDNNQDRQQKREQVMWLVVGGVGIFTLGILAWYLKKK